MDKCYVTWGIVDSCIDLLVKKIKKEKIKFDGVYGVPRGGLVMAVMLSHRLNLNLLSAPTKKSLVVDDISDMGDTLLGIVHKKIFCLVRTKWTKVVPDYSYFTKSHKREWIVFPWEVTKNGRK